MSRGDVGPEVGSTMDPGRSSTTLAELCSACGGRGTILNDDDTKTICPICDGRSTVILHYDVREDNVVMIDNDSDSDDGRERHTQC